MLKTNNPILSNLIYFLAVLLSASVLLLSVHAKDLVAYSNGAVVRQIGYKDISDKAAKELHDHVDKQVLKNKVTDKSFNNFTAIRNRDEMDEYEDQDPGLWGRLHETIMLIRVWASLPFALA